MQNQKEMEKEDQAPSPSATTHHSDEGAAATQPATDQQPSSRSGASAGTSNGEPANDGHTTDPLAACRPPNSPTDTATTSEADTHPLAPSPAPDAPSSDTDPQAALPESPNAADRTGDKQPAAAHPPHGSPATACPPIRSKTYFNRLLTVANHLQPYPVYTLQLHNVDHFFRASGGADSGVDMSAPPPPSQPRDRTHRSRLKTALDRLTHCMHPSAAKAAERRRLRSVLSASLLTQPYNRKPANIRALFAATPQGAAMRATTRAVHRKLYGKGVLFGALKRREKAWLHSGADLLALIERHGGAAKPQRAEQQQQSAEAAEKRARKNVAPCAGCEYTYTLLADGVLHFSRADTPVLDMASKHAMHSSAAPDVVYAGTLRIEERPRNNSNNDSHNDTTNTTTAAATGTSKVLVMDNDSGTYAPRTDRGELRRLKALMQCNFPGLAVDVRAYVPPGLDDESKSDEEGSSSSEESE